MEALFVYFFPPYLVMPIFTTAMGITRCDGDAHHIRCDGVTSWSLGLVLIASYFGVFVALWCLNACVSSVIVPFILFMHWPFTQLTEMEKASLLTRSFPTILVFYFKSTRNTFQFITILVPEGVSTVNSYCTCFIGCSQQCGPTDGAHLSDGALHFD